MKSKPEIVEEEESEKERFIRQGLHVDWLVRAHLVNNLDTLVYLSQQRENWVHENQKAILTILQDYANSDKGLIAANEPPPLRGPQSPVKQSPDTGPVYDFTCRLLEMVKNEPVIWDRDNEPEFGYHQPMRQAWCGISLKLGGWGAMQHVQMLKQYYRRKRDQYNIEHLRHGKPFVYSQQLSFLRNLLGMTSGSEVHDVSVTIAEYVEASAPGLDYDLEILEAPQEIQDILRKVSETIDRVAAVCPPEALSEFLADCCEQVVSHREHVAVSALCDVDAALFIDEDE